MGTLSGKIALVTGASRGVGKGIALSLGAQGATVYVTGRTVTEGESATKLEGTVHATGHNATFTLLPAEKFKGVATDRPQTVERSRGHEMDWLLACRGGKPAWANFDYADALNEFLMLGNIATQMTGPIAFDPAACRIVGNDEADRLVRPPYREGWTL